MIEITIFLNHVKIATKSFKDVPKINEYICIQPQIYHQVKFVLWNEYGEPIIVLHTDNIPFNQFLR